MHIGRSPCFALAVAPLALTMVTHGAAQAPPPAYTTLHSFTGPVGDGAHPAAGVVVAPSGVVYGTTFAGNFKSEGTLFELIPPVAGGSWTERILFNFGHNGAGDGCRPYGDLLMVNGVIY